MAPQKSKICLMMFPVEEVSMIGNTTITNCRQTHGTVRKSHTTTSRHQEAKLSKATSSLFPIKMTAKLEWTQSNAQQRQTPTMGVTINNKSTTTEPQNHRTTALERTAA